MAYNFVIFIYNIFVDVFDKDSYCAGFASLSLVYVSAAQFSILTVIKCDVYIFKKFKFTYLDLNVYISPLLKIN